MEKLEIGKNYKIGKYDKCRIGGGYFLCLDDIENNNIYTQFGITKKDIYKILGYTPSGQFPTCKTLDDLQKVYEYIMSKDPNNKKTINVEDLKYPDEDKFIVGKWYVYSDCYLKFSHKRGERYYGECIKIDKTFDKAWFWSAPEHIKNCVIVTDLSIIQPYLPEGHIDKIPVRKSLVFKKGIWYKYHNARFYMHCSKDATDTLFYDKYIEVSTGYIGKDNSSYSNQYITEEEVPFSEIEKYIPNENIKREDLIVGQIYVGTWDVTKKVIFNYSGDLNNNNHIINNDGNYRFSGCFKNNYDVTFRLATKKEKELLISKIPKETMKEQINFIHGEYYVDRVNSGGSRIFKYDKPNYQLYYINTAVKCFFINNYDSSLEKDSVPATQKEIDWLNKCIKANRFVSENYFVELTSLPEKWCVKPRTIKEADEIFTYKGIKKYSDSNSIEYYQHYPSFNSCCTASSTIRDGYTEITYEQFKKWVIKEETDYVEEGWKPVKGEWCYYGGAAAGGIDTGFGFWEKGVIAKFDEEDRNIWRFTENSSKLMNASCSNKSCAFRKATPEEVENYLKTIKTPIIETKEHYNETINSSTTVESSTKGTLPLYNVKKRLVLN